VDQQTVTLEPEEADLVMALLVDRKARTAELAKNSRSRTTRHARSYELTILDRIAVKMGGWPSEEEVEDVDDGEAPGPTPAHDDEKDLQEGRLFDKPPETAPAKTSRGPRRLAADE
jgi:hypothetical protein